MAILTRGCHRSYWTCKLFPIVSRAFGAVIENGSINFRKKTFNHVSQKLSFIRNLLNCHKIRLVVQIRLCLIMVCATLKCKQSSCNDYRDDLSQVCCPWLWKSWKVYTSNEGISSQLKFKQKRNYVQKCQEETTYYLKPLSAISTDMIHNIPYTHERQLFSYKTCYQFYQSDCLCRCNQLQFL